MNASASLLHIPAGEVVLRDARREETRTICLNSFELSAQPYCSAAARSPLTPLAWFEAIRLCNDLSNRDGLDLAYTIEGRSVQWRTEADGYRLPTEAEWEYACRAGTSTPTYGHLQRIAWTSLDNVDAPQPSGTKEPNAWGLQDMLGNVWEWCWDYADPARYGDYRSLRGGGWVDEPWSVRASVRGGVRRTPSWRTSGCAWPVVPLAVPAMPRGRDGRMRRIAVARASGARFRWAGRRCVRSRTETKCDLKPRWLGVSGPTQSASSRIPAARRRPAP